MTPERWQKIEELFQAASEMAPTERAEFLNRACEGDLWLRQKIESLLAHSQQPVNLLDQPPIAAVCQILSAAQDQSIVGQTISSFKILAKIGAGGMGEVYLAKDTRLGRKVALKLLSASFIAQNRQMLLFEQEARAASALNCPNIVTIYEVGQTDFWHFIAMEFVSGLTLREYLRGARIPLREAIRIAAQVAEALAAAHQAEIIHKDIKPENIMVRDDRAVKVLDFGIAQLTEQHPSPSDDKAEGASLQKTKPALVMGTASYMSPEQAKGDPLNSTTDLFSLGTLLYEMIAGRRPFTGETIEDLLHAVINDEPPPLNSFRGNLPTLLQVIVSKALKKDRSERYQSAGEMLAELKRLADQLDRSGNQEASRYTASIDSTTSVPPMRQARAVEVLPSSNLSPALRQPRALSLQVATILSIALILMNGILLWTQWGWRLGNTILASATLLCVAVFFYARNQKVRRVNIPLQEVAFRGLAAFQEEDSEQFYGREADCSTLFDKLNHPRFRVGALYGDSGAGKTSLVKAGLTLALKKAGYTLVTCRSNKDPLAALEEEVTAISRVEPLKEETPIEYLRRMTGEPCCRLVIIFDQFEEFFTTFKSKREREPFLAFVAACYSETSLPLKLLFSIRSDFLYLFSSAFDGRIPEPLLGDKRYQLHNFDEEQAAQVIEKSARRANLPFETALCRQVARDLAKGDTVLPSELQIVGLQLQNKGIYTLNQYNRVGGKPYLVHSYLEDLIEKSEDQRASQIVLRSLISDENTRLTLPVKDIVRRSELSREVVEKTISYFVSSRLVQEIQESDPWHYELMHDYLIDKVNEVTSEVLNATQRANRLFRQYLSNYALESKTRIPLNKAWFIRKHSDLKRGAGEQELLTKSFRRGALQAMGATALLLLLTAGISAVAAWQSRGEEWQSLRLSDGHTMAVRRAVFSPDGKWVVSGGEDGKVMVWDFAKRERVATLMGHTEIVSALDFSPDGKWFASGSYDHTVIIWDVKRLEMAVVLREHRDRIGGVAFSPDGKFLVTSSGQTDERTILWEVGRWEKIREIVAGLPDHGSLLFATNLRLLLYGSVWDLSTGKSVPNVLEDSWRGTWSALSPDKSQLVSVDPSGYVKFVDLNQHRLLMSQPGHQDNGRAVAYSPDGRWVATGAENIVLWDAAKRTKVARLEHTAIVWSLAFSPDGRHLISSHGDGSILLWNVEERERVANFNEHSGAVRAVAYSLDGKYIASGGEDRSVIIWDSKTGEKETVLVKHNTKVNAVTFSFDGQWLASGDQDGEMIIWDLARREPRLIIKDKLDGSSFCLAISPDRRWLASTHGVYDLSSDQEVVDFHKVADARISYGEMYGVAFSADGRRLASVSPVGKQLCLWDTQSWEIVDKVETLGISLSFSLDGKQLVIGADDGTVRLWSIQPLREIGVIGRHTARVKSVAFSPDGKQVASASDDRTIALWEVANRRLITQIGTHTAPVLSVAFSPDGKRLVAGGHDYSVRLYTRHRTVWGSRWD